MSLVAGTKLGRYEIRSQLGAGGMGEVYRARDTQLGRDVAIKVLPSTYSVDQDRLHRFEQEACAASALNHPNILIVHDIGAHDGAPYVVSELLEGETLRNRIGGTPLGQRRAIEYALQIAHGLAAAHEKGIVHRDLKPDNIFITNDGRVKILDFGLAKLTQGDGNQPQTEIPTRRVDTDPGVVMGTAGYVSPEQLKGRPVDQRSDIFSFGAILYEMLSGQRAFHGESAAETMSAILKEDPLELSDTNKTVSPALERLVNHCLEKTPEARFHSARDLAFALEALSGSALSSAQTVALPASEYRWTRNRERLVWIVVSTLLFTAAIAFGLSYFRRSPEAARAVRLTIPPPEKGVVSVLSISPDGRLVVYGAPGAEGKGVLWVRPLDSFTAQPLPGTDGPFFTTFWSPDSRFVGFVSSTDNKLKKIDVTGGPPQTLADAPNAAGATWNRDGVIVFSPHAGPLFRVSASGGEVTQVTTLDESRQEISHRWPYFLPDGRHFLYFVRGARAEATSIYAGSLDSKETKRLVSADSGAMYSPPGYLLYVREGTLMAQSFDAGRLELSGEAVPVAEGIGFSDLTANFARFSVSDNGALVYYAGEEFNNVQLTWFDRGGKQIGTVGQPGNYRNLRLSPDGKRLALSQRDPQTKRLDIWLMELAARDTFTRFTFDPANEVSPVWSPDGTRIVFASNKDGQINLYQKLSTGAGNDEALFKSDRPTFSNDWSPDGRFIVYHVLSGKTRADLWVLPLDGDRKPFLFLQTPFGEREARFSPDGRWVAYTSDETGTREVWVQSFPAGRGKWQISRGGGGPPNWRGDGKELFYANAGKLMVVEVKTGAETFEASTPKPLFEIRGAATFDVTADGQRFLLAVPNEDATSTPIAVVLNWAADLKR